MVVVNAFGKREVVQATPSTPLVSVLEAVCKRLGLSQSNLSLFLKGKELDLAVPLRLQGIQPNAILELKKVSKGKGEKVHVVFQLEDGQRIGPISAFPDTPLIIALQKAEEVAGANILRVSAPSRPAEKRLFGKDIPGGERMHCPVSVYAMNREFSDLQANLESMGIIKGQYLLRVTHRMSDIPIEEGVQLITLYEQSARESWKQTREANKEKIERAKARAQEKKRQVSEASATDLERVADEIEEQKRVEEEVNLRLMKVAEAQEERSARSENERALRAERRRQYEKEEYERALAREAEAEYRDSEIGKDRNAVLKVIRNEIEAEGRDRGEQPIPDDRGLSVGYPRPGSDAPEFDPPSSFFELDRSEIRRQQALAHSKATEAGPQIARRERAIEAARKNAVTQLKIVFPDRSFVQGMFRGTETVADLRLFLKSKVLKRSDICFELIVTPPVVRLSNFNAPLYTLGLVPTGSIYVVCDESGHLMRESLLSQLNVSPAPPVAAAPEGVGKPMVKPAVDDHMDREEKLRKIQGLLFKRH